jgi:hypothetical protein
MFTPPAGFEPIIQTSERPLTNALDGVVTGIVEKLELVAI